MTSDLIYEFVIKCFVNRIMKKVVIHFTNHCQTTNRKLLFIQVPYKVLKYMLELS